jgi:hypothetical protein
MSRTKLHLSKTPLILFTFTQIFLGIHFGFVKIASKKTEKLLKCLCVFSFFNVLVLVSLVPIYKHPEQLPFYIAYIVEYVCYSLIFYISKYTFYDFVLDYSEIDDILKLDHKSLDGTIIMTLAYPVISCAIKQILYISYCSLNVTSQYCKPIFFEYATNSIVVIAVDSLVLIQFTIMYMCYKRVNILRLKLLNNELGAIDVVRIYKRIFDSLDKIKPIINKLVRNIIKQYY